MGKTFTDENNPLYRFIGAVEQEKAAEPTEPTAPQEQEKQDPRADGRTHYPEIKSRRVQIVMQPTLYETAKDRAKQEGVSFNEIVHRALKDYLEQ